jgi:hypothetical protein
LEGESAGFHAAAIFQRQTAPLLKQRVKVIRHTGFVKLEEKHETFAHFRDFLPQYRPFDVGF